jgi:hypothetical protein
VRRLRPTAPANDSIEAVPVYTPDPHGAALFAGVTNGTLGHLGARPVIDARGDSWHGWTAPPQRMTGAAFLGRGRPTVPKGTRLDQERGAVAAPDPIRAAFEQRLSGGPLG